MRIPIAEVRILLFPRRDGTPGASLTVNGRRLEGDPFRRLFAVVGEWRNLFHEARALSERETRCRSCGAPIVWGETESGSKIPLDVEPDPHGNLRVIVSRSNATGTTVRALTPTGGVGYHRSHFATCPDAKAWRKPKG